MLPFIRNVSFFAQMLKSDVIMCSGLWTYKMCKKVFHKITNSHSNNDKVVVRLKYLYYYLNKQRRIYGRYI